MPSVGIIQRVLPHYRIPFFVGLADRLARENIDLKLIYGQEYPGTVPKTADIHNVWAHRIRNRYLKLFGIEMVWQPCMSRVSNCELVVVEQSNRLLANYALMAKRKRGRFKLAYWGHGRNLQSTRQQGLREGLKRQLVGAVDWWFAYTNLSEDIVRASGFPRNRITVVQNAVSTREIDAQVSSITQTRLRAVREEIGIRSENVGVYCGGMYPDKKLEFLVEACLAVRSTIPDFEVILIGEGPEQHIVESAARHHPWLHYVGPKYGADRVAYLLAARILMMPGLVGLAIVDSFAARVPLFTTDIPIHSPEIAYLENGVNGVITEPAVEAYAGAVAEYLSSDSRLAILRHGCAESAMRYTLENMIENFATGVVQCLST